MRRVELRLRRLLGAPLAHVADHAHHGDPVRRGVGEAEALADRILVGPRDLGEALIDDHVRRGGGGVRGLQEPAPEERDPHRLEVSAVHGRHLDQRTLSLVPAWRCALDPDVPVGPAEQRQAGDRADAHHARDRADVREHLVVVALVSSLVRVTRASRVERHRDHALHREAEVLAAECRVAADEQHGCVREYEPECDLTDDERVAEPLPGRRQRRVPALLHAGRQVDARREQRGHDAEHERRDRRRCERERERPPVHAHLADARDRWRQERFEAADRDVREEHPEHSADECEQERLREEEPDHRTPARAQRGAHGQLGVARRRAREEQTGDVAARDEQHEPGGAQNHPELPAHRAQQVLVHGEELRVPVGVRLRVLLGKPARDAVHVGLRGFLRRVRGQPPDHGPRVTCAVPLEKPVPLEGQVQAMRAVLRPR